MPRRNVKQPRERAEQEARFQELLDQMPRNDQRARYDRYTGRRIDNDRDRDDDDD